MVRDDGHTVETSRGPLGDGGWFATQNDSIDMMAVVGPLAYCVYSVLCRFADRNRRCYPSIETIANKCGVGERSVQLALRKLEAASAVIAEPRSANGKTLSNQYYLPRLKGATDCAPVTTCAPESECRGATEFTGGAQPVAPEGRTVLRPNKTKEKKTALNKTSSVGPDDVTWPTELDTPECRESLRLWLAYKREIKKPYKSRVSVETLLRRLAANGADRFRDAIEHSIAQGYQGIYESDLRSKANGQRKHLVGAGQQHDPAAAKDPEHGSW